MPSAGDVGPGGSADRGRRNGAKRMAGSRQTSFLRAEILGKEPIACRLAPLPAVPGTCDGEMLGTAESMRTLEQCCVMLDINEAVGVPRLTIP